MKSFSLLLSAAALLAFGGSAHAGAREVTQYLEQAGAVAAAKVEAAGVDVGAGLDVKGRVSSDGGLTALRVIRSTGSAETDQKALKALKRLRVAGPPNALVGAEVTVTVGKASTLAAKAP